MPTVTDLLVQRGEALLHAPAERLAFTGDRAADDLLNDLAHYPHAFVLACVMDRQMTAERAWLIPHRIAERLGNFEFATLCTLTLDDVRRLMTEPTSLHRFKNKMSVSFYEGVQRIANVYGGNASRIWSDRPACYEVVGRFRQFHGVGQKIAAMAVLILVREFKIPLPDLPSLPIAPDVHVCRVFSRLGLCREDAEPDEVADRARSLHPQFPGILDIGAWTIGRTWCRPSNPRCGECFMHVLCPTAADESRVRNAD
jgi:uncharacterized HhH-GPD family protein